MLTVGVTLGGVMAAGLWVLYFAAMGVLLGLGLPFFRGKVVGGALAGGLWYDDVPEDVIGPGEGGRGFMLPWEVLLSLGSVPLT